MSWLVGRVGPDDFRQPGRLEEMREWLRSLDVDPTNMALHAVVARQRDGQYVLHLTENVRGEGGVQFDVAADRVVSLPVRIPVEKDSWPAWLTGMRTPAKATT